MLPASSPRPRLSLATQRRDQPSTLARFGGLGLTRDRRGRWLTNRCGEACLPCPTRFPSSGVQSTSTVTFIVQFLFAASPAIGAKIAKWESQQPSQGLEMVAVVSRRIGCLSGRRRRGDRGQGDGYEGCDAGVQKPPDPSKTKFTRARSLDRRRHVRRLSWGEIPVTDNRWELAVVTLVAIAAFFSVWHLVAPLIG
jgi:hypothetical protein